MKARELIEILQKYDPELKVLVEGYEGGLQAPGIRETKFKLDPHLAYYSGEELGWGDDEGFEPCLVIGR